jgi:hypothetical protein
MSVNNNNPPKSLGASSSPFGNAGMPTNPSFTQSQAQAQIGAAFQNQFQLSQAQAIAQAQSKAAAHAHAQAQAQAQLKLKLKLKHMPKLKPNSKLSYKLKGCRSTRAMQRALVIWVHLHPPCQRLVIWVSSGCPKNLQSALLLVPL